MDEKVFCNSNLLIQLSALVLDDYGYIYASNQVIYSDPTGHNIIKIDNQGNANIFLSGSDSELGWICDMVYVSGYIYIVNNTATILRVDISNANLTTFAILPDLAGGAFGITYYNGFLYVVEPYRNNNTQGPIYKIDITNGSNVTTLISWGTEYFLGPVYIAIDNSGNIYISDSGYSTSTSGYVLKFDINGNLLNKYFISGINYSRIVFFQNNLYFTNSWVSDTTLPNQLSQYDMNGTLITNNYAMGGLTEQGGGLVFDRNGQFYVTDEVGGFGSAVCTILTNANNNNPLPLPIIACFKQDTKILTDKGYVMIQKLRNGDLIKTLDNGFVPINMIGYKNIYNNCCIERKKNHLYLCSQENYPEIFEDLIITGCHSILVDEFKEGERESVVELLGKIYITDNKYRLPACLDKRAEIYKKKGTYRIYHIALNNDNFYFNYGIYANGLLVETCSKRYLKELSDMTLII